MAGERTRVFLNACHVARPVPALEGAGGLVRAWTKVGAGAYYYYGSLTAAAGSPHD